MSGWRGEAKHFGVVKARSLVKAAGDCTPPEKAAIDAHRTKEQADICLTCKKKECTGSDGCFNRRRKELKCKDSGNA